MEVTLVELSLVEVTLVLCSLFPAGSSGAGHSRVFQQHCRALVPVQAAVLPAASSKGLALTPPSTTLCLEK